MSVYTLHTLKTFGIEIENNTHLPTLLQAILDKTGASYHTESRHSGTAYVIDGGALDRWEVQHDGSVDGCEVVSPALHLYDMRTQLAILCEIFKELRTTAGRDCGLHVHVGHENHGSRNNVSAHQYYGYTLDTIQRLIKLMHTRDYISRKGVASGHWREGYCKPYTDAFVNRAMKARNYKELRFAWYGYDTGEDGSGDGGYYDNTRYHALNLHCLFGSKRNGTVEFRMFNGTVNYDTICAYVDYCAGMVEMAERQNRISDARAARTCAEDENPRYSFRTFINKMGLVGDEFKTTRKVLRQYVEGVSNRRHRGVRF